jgi:hypothetical protein
VKFVRYVLDVYGFPTNFRGLVLRVIRYMLDVYRFPCKFWVLGYCMLFVIVLDVSGFTNFRFFLVLRVVRYVLDVYGFLQILGFSVACCSLCVGCLWFPCKF